MDTLAGRPYWSLSFAQDGSLTAPTADTFVEEVASSGVRELFVLSHGWNSSQAEAEELYRDLLPRVARAAGQVPTLGPVGLVGVFWPALWFPNRTGPSDQGAGRDDSQTTGELGRPIVSGDADLTGAEIAETLRRSFGDDARDVVEQLGRLIDEGAAAAAGSEEPDAVQRARLAEFHGLLRQLVPDPGQIAPEDRGERSVLVSPDPERDYQAIAAAFGDIPAGGSGQGVGDVFRSVWNGAKSVMRIASYQIMKDRAGAVGRNGLGSLLTRLHASDAAVRVHLVGHSFGGRLVAFALAGIPSAGQSPVASLVLIQAAFSHYSFSSAKDNPFEAEGALREMADRVHGPLVATYSKYDRAVGTWYPKASALARQDNQASPTVSRWGALGSSGFQAVAPLDGVRVHKTGEDYGFAPSRFYSIDSSRVISDVGQSLFAGAHSDIRHPEIAWLIADTAGSGEPPS